MVRIILILFLFSICSAHAQIGYQVALLNQKTGEPRANETVSVTISITDNAGTMVCSETKSATTNGAGILSLEVGNASTFDNTQWDKLPLWVSATVDGVTIGRTQILSVPVAEHAKHYGVITPRHLASKTWHGEYYGDDNATLTFTKSGSARIKYSSTDNFGRIETYTNNYKYYIEGNTVALCGEYCQTVLYIPEIDKLLLRDDDGNTHLFD
jgi:hypothetical protein